jgi:hypothetical protein
LDYRDYGHKSGAAICALMSTRTLGVAEDAAKEVCALCANVQAIFFRRCHQPRRPQLAKRRPGSPAPAMGPGTTFVIAPNSPSLSQLIPSVKKRVKEIERELVDIVQMAAVQEKRSLVELRKRGDPSVFEVQPHGSGPALRRMPS